MIFIKNKEKYEVGTIHMTNEGYKIKVLKKLKNERRIIIFLDTYCHEKEVGTTSIRDGSIGNPYHKSVFGVGYLGVGKYSTFENSKPTRIYTSWINMFRRCYSESFIKENTAYKNVTICEEWHCFQNFAMWYEFTYPYHIKDIKFQLDKDLLQQNNKNKIYSPSTCVWLPEKINKFIVGANCKGYTYSNSRNKYIAQITYFNAEKRKNLGYYNSKEEAILNYKEHRVKSVKEAKNYLINLNYLSDEIINLIK